MGDSNKIKEILISNGIKKSTIIDETEYITFKHKKITYVVQYELNDEYIYGLDEFDNGALSQDYLKDNYTEYGTIGDFEDYVYHITKGQAFDKLYKITEMLFKLEDDADENDIDFESIVNHMFYNG